MSDESQYINLSDSDELEIRIRTDNLRARAICADYWDVTDGQWRYRVAEIAVKYSISVKAVTSVVSDNSTVYSDRSCAFYPDEFCHYRTRSAIEQRTCDACVRDSSFRRSALTRATDSLRGRAMGREGAPHYEALLGESKRVHQVFQDYGEVEHLNRSEEKFTIRPFEPTLEDSEVWAALERKLSCHADQMRYFEVFQPLEREEKAWIYNALWSNHSPAYVRQTLWYTMSSRLVLPGDPATCVRTALGDRSDRYSSETVAKYLMTCDLTTFIFAGVQYTTIHCGWTDLEEGLCRYLAGT